MKVRCPSFRHCDELLHSFAAAVNAEQKLWVGAELDKILSSKPLFTQVCTSCGGFVSRRFERDETTS